MLGGFTMNEYLPPELIEVFEWTIKDATVRIKNQELTYSTWKSYVNILKKNRFICKYQQLIIMNLLVYW